MYGDVFVKIGDAQALMQAFPQPLAGHLDLRMQVLLGWPNYPQIEKQCYYPIEPTQKNFGSLWVSAVGNWLTQNNLAYRAAL
jgi:hypothetical protein